MTEYIALHFGGHCATEFGMIMEQALSAPGAIIDCLHTPGEIEGHIPAPYGRVVPREIDPIREGEVISAVDIENITRKLGARIHKAAMYMDEGDAYRELLHMTSRPTRPNEQMDDARFRARQFHLDDYCIGYDWVFDTQSAHTCLLSYNERRSELIRATEAPELDCRDLAEYLVVRTSVPMRAESLAHAILDLDGSDFVYVADNVDVSVRELDGARIQIAHLFFARKKRRAPLLRATHFFSK